MTHAIVIDLQALTNTQVETLKVEMWVVLLMMLNLTPQTHASDVILKKQILTQPYALCNDGSKGAYYLHHDKKKTKWLLFAEGGGGCKSTRQCAERFQTSPHLMSSNAYPSTITASSLLADGDFDDYNKVLMIYCSSDSWLGNSLAKTPFPSTDDKMPTSRPNRVGSTTKVTLENTIAEQNIGSLKNFVYQGSIIFRAVIDELGKKGLHNASHVLLAGASAGGVGVFNHVDYMQQMGPKVSVLVDSSWFINYNGLFASDQASNMRFVASTGIMRKASCLDNTWGYPCCFSTSCLLARGYIPVNVPILAIISKFDVYTIFNSNIQQQINDGGELNLVNLLNKFHSFGGQMEHSLNLVKLNHPQLSYIFSTCLQHVYLATSDLWGTLYDSNIRHQFPRVRFDHMVQPTNWETTQLGGKNLRAWIADWKRRVLLNDNEPIKIADDCEHVQCNPTCPRVVYFQASQHYTMAWKIITLITIVLTIIFICFVIKLVWLVQHWKLQRTQKNFLSNSDADVEGRNSVTCLPACPPHSCIGISCTKLNYDISEQVINESNLTGSRQGSMRLRKPSLRNLRRKSVSAHGRQIIKGVSAYFNPGQLIAIMGPSGSGKTTLLDVLTARKKHTEAEKHIFINGLSADETRDWFIKNSGYVLQSAMPYHEELTVRQNLTYSAMMRLPAKMAVKEKMWRVEQVLGQTGLNSVADVVVNSLSGGQKRRLCVGLQLVDLPSVIFLDEPTSGLDSASSLELLETLHGLTLSGRLVVVTIHQPRIEIFHMFDSILFLCDGQVAYFGSPLMAPTMIAEALQGSGKVSDSSNPADMIMDVLTDTESQNIIVTYYKQSGEIEAIHRAIARARRHPQKTLSMKFQKQTSSIANRLLALDGRCSSSQTFAQRVYFPLIFMVFSVALGTCYYQTTKGILLMSCYMVFLCASQLFLSSVIHAHLNKAFALFALEKADGIGHSHELVFHAFVRIFLLSSVPLVCACIVIYACTVQDYSWYKFSLTTLLHVQLNKVWISMIICIACSTPSYSHLLTPMASAVAGFAGGFLVPVPQMPDYYSWLFYINPTHWAYRATMYLLIEDTTFSKESSSILQRQQSAGSIVLESFGIHDTNPFLSMLVLLVMLLFYLTMSVIILEIRHAKPNWRTFLVRHMIALKGHLWSRCDKLHFRVSEKKHQREESERQRLFELASKEYTYQSPLLTSEQTDQVVVPVTTDDNEIDSGRKRIDTITTGDEGFDESDDSSNVEDNFDGVLSAYLQVKNTRSKSRSNSSFSSFFSKLRSNNEEPKVKLRTKRHRKKRKVVENRRKTFTGVLDEEEQCKICDSKNKQKRPLSLIHPCDHVAMTMFRKMEPQDSTETLTAERTARKNSLQMAMLNSRDCDAFQRKLRLISHGQILEEQLEKQEKKQPEKRRRRAVDQRKETKSKYLDSKRHEVYCALSSVKRRIRGSRRNKKEASDDKVAKQQRLVKASSLVENRTVQRRASLLILKDRQFSMRCQLLGFREQLVQEGGLSPMTEKRMHLLRARDKFQKSSAPSDDQPSSPATDRKELLERLSMLSSQRSSVASCARHSTDIRRVSGVDVASPTLPLNDTVYELDEFLPDLDVNKYVDGRPRSQHSADVSKYREDDPLLPNERALVEGLLNKYSHLDKRYSRQSRFPFTGETLTFSSEMKIKGSSPCASRKTSVSGRPRFDSLPAAILHNAHPPSTTHNAPVDECERNMAEMPVVEVIAPDEPVSPSLNISTISSTSHPQFRLQAPTVPIPRKISITVKSVARPPTRLSSSGEIAEECEQPNSLLTVTTNEQPLLAESEYEDHSLSSDYEEELVKNEEGFIIPDSTLKNVKNSAAAVGRKKSQNRQNEIERQFKKENFLKDLPFKKGIKMPAGSAGKVHQLLSKFENRNPSSELGKGRTRESLEKLNQKPAVGKARKFFKVLKATRSSYDSSDSEVEGALPMMNSRPHSAKCRRDLVADEFLDERELIFKRPKPFRQYTAIYRASFSSDDIGTSLSGQSVDIERLSLSNKNKRRSISASILL